MDQGRQGEMQAHREMGLRLVIQIGSPDKGSHVFYLCGIGRDLDVNLIQDRIIPLELLGPLLAPASLQRHRCPRGVLPHKREMANRGLDS